MCCEFLLAFLYPQFIIVMRIKINKLCFQVLVINASSVHVFFGSYSLVLLKFNTVDMYPGFMVVFPLFFPCFSNTRQFAGVRDKS